jgi:NAD(P)-dependent dehydrogenase (short-subunit alcohol dehydrogenase family)
MLECFSVRDKVIIITGALGLLGTTYTEGFAKEGANVVLVDLDGEVCRKRAKEVSGKYGTEALGIGCDITKPEEVEKMVRKAVAEYGRIDVLINNAALQTEHFFAPFEEYPLKDWEEVMRVDVTGVFLCSQAVAKEMEKRKSGSIVNIASIYGVVAPDQQIYEGAIYRGKKINTPPVYSTSKGAVLSLTRYLAAYLAKYGIRVNAVTPGGVYSGQNEAFVKRYSEKCPLGRMASPQEIFQAVYFVACDASSYITGHNLVVDGGWTVW